MNIYALDCPKMNNPGTPATMEEISLQINNVLYSITSDSTPKEYDRVKAQNPLYDIYGSRIHTLSLAGIFQNLNLFRHMVRLELSKTLPLQEDISILILYFLEEENLASYEALKIFQILHSFGLMDFNEVFGNKHLIELAAACQYNGQLIHYFVDCGSIPDSFEFANPALFEYVRGVQTHLKQINSKKKELLMMATIGGKSKGSSLNGLYIVDVLSIILEMYNSMPSGTHFRYVCTDPIPDFT